MAFTTTFGFRARTHLASGSTSTATSPAFMMCFALIEVYGPTRGHALHALLTAVQQLRKDDFPTDCGRLCLLQDQHWIAGIVEPMDYSRKPVPPPRTTIRFFIYAAHPLSFYEPCSAPAHPCGRSSPFFFTIIL